MEGIRKTLVHRVQKHYTVGMADYERVMREHGTAATATFTLPPHANEVLKLFWECDIKQCLPVAFYEAAVRGVNSITSSGLKVFLPPQILAPAVKALGLFLSKHTDHVRSTLESVRMCSVCRRLNLVSIEHSLLPPKNDLLLSPLRDLGFKPDVVESLCQVCVVDITNEGRAFRCAFWDELPSMFGLPTWRELSKFVVLK